MPKPGIRGNRTKTPTAAAGGRGLPMPRLSQLLVSRDRQFFDLFEEAASNILRAADLLDQMLRGYPENAALARDILICEQEGDRITHDIIRRLNEMFVTPID